MQLEKQLRLITPYSFWPKLGTLPPSYKVGGTCPCCSPPRFPRLWPWAWASLRMCASKRWTLDTSGNCCDKYSAIWQETFQFLSNVTRFLDCFFFGNYYKFELITFARQCDNTVKVWWEVFYGFVGNLLLLPAVKEFWKSVKNRLSPWVWRTTCGDTVPYCMLNGTLNSARSLNDMRTSLQKRTERIIKCVCLT